MCDAKRFDRPFDRRRVRGALSEDPVAQIIHYVAVTRRRWGILTNGRLWRLYAAEGDLVEGACLEVDLCALLDAGDAETFRYFAVLFSAAALTPDADGRGLLDRALDGSRAHAVGVGERLRAQVFAAVPLVAEGLLGDEERTPEALTSAFDNALVVLHRLLFCLHAEDRGLLPVANVHYAAYSLRAQRNALARDRDAGRVFSSQSDDKFNDLRALFRIVDRGDTALGVNEYDGGLFSPASHPWLHGRTVPDNLMSLALDLLYRVGGEQVDYRNLSVRHLGTIFEQLLALALAEGSDGRQRASFLAWLASVCGTPLRTLDGWTKLVAYDRLGRAAALDVLDANAKRLKIDPRARAHRERVSTELDASAVRIAMHGAELRRLERDVDATVAEAYD